MTKKIKPSHYEILRKISWALVGIYVFGVIAVLLGITVLGGMPLLAYLKTTLIQAIGITMAATASLFFFLRLIWRLEALPLGISILVFILGSGMFVSASVGQLYAFQYPMYVQSYGTGSGPGLPFKNVLSFFRHLETFEVVKDISENPNNVPSPINQLIAGGAIEPVTDDTLPTTRRIQLEAKEVLAEIAPGVTFNYWTFNGTVPGPLFRAQVGDIIEVTISNHASSLHHHNVDFHAATGPGGGGAVSVVNPGESKTFRFKTLNPGLFVYHCAVPNMASHMAHGMYGLFLVEPKEGLPKVDKEFYVMQGELYTAGTIGRKGLQIFDAKKMMDGQPEYITFNGKTGGLDSNMKAFVGDKVRLYVGNGGVSHTSSFHIVGEIFDTVYPEASIGGARFHNVQTTNIPAGGAAIVELTVDYPGKYILVDHALMRTDKGAWGVLEVVGSTDPEIMDGNFTEHARSSHGH